MINDTIAFFLQLHTYVYIVPTTSAEGTAQVDDSENTGILGID